MELAQESENGYGFIKRVKFTEMAERLLPSALSAFAEDI